MEFITDLLTPEQLDAILAVYGTVEAWIGQATDFVIDQYCNVTIHEDIMI
jgi:hypothetical protein